MRRVRRFSHQASRLSPRSGRRAGKNLRLRVRVAVRTPDLEDVLGANVDACHESHYGTLSGAFPERRCTAAHFPPQSARQLCASDQAGAGSPRGVSPTSPGNLVQLVEVVAATVAQGVARSAQTLMVMRFRPCLENRYPSLGGSRVQIPPPPLEPAEV